MHSNGNGIGGGVLGGGTERGEPGSDRPRRAAAASPRARACRGCQCEGGELGQEWAWGGDTLCFALPTPHIGGSGVQGAVGV